MEGEIQQLPEVKCALPKYTSVNNYNSNSITIIEYNQTLSSTFIISIGEQNYQY